jgi:hypothetical protein
MERRCALRAQAGRSPAQAGLSEAMPATNQNIYLYCACFMLVLHGPQVHYKVHTFIHKQETCGRIHFLAPKIIIFLYYIKMYPFFKFSPSKTRKGRKDFTTKKGSKVFHRKKHYVRKSYKPYSYHKGSKSKTHKGKRDYISQ